MFNVEAVKEISQDTPTSKAVFETLSERRRYRKETNLAKLRYQLMAKGESISESQYLDTFKKLEQAGVGSIIAQRGKKPARFVWDYNLKDVAAVAKGNLSATEVEKFSENKPLTSSKRKGKKSKMRIVDVSNSTNLIETPISITLSIRNKTQLESLLNFLGQ